MTLNIILNAPPPPPLLRLRTVGLRRPGGDGRRVGTRHRAPRPMTTAYPLSQPGTGGAGHFARERGEGIYIYVYILILRNKDFG